MNYHNIKVTKYEASAPYHPRVFGEMTWEIQARIIITCAKVNLNF